MNVNENKELLARELKVARAKLGLTQEGLAKKSGVSECAIALIESKCSTGMPRIDTLIKLEKALELEENTLTKYI